MPACFQLIGKTTGQPTKFTEVDNAICRHFGVVPDEVKYFCSWYDLIGFKLAMGESFQQIRTEFERQAHEWLCERGDSYAAVFCYTVVRIVGFLERNYESTSWYEVGRR